MNRFNQPKGRKTQTPAAIVTDVKQPPRQRTSEETMAIQQRRIIERGTQRIQQQGKICLELKKKAQTKAVLPKVSPRPPAITLTQPFTRKLATIPLAEAAEPKLTPAA